MKNFLLILLMIMLVGVGVTGCERDMTKPVMDTGVSPDPATLLTVSKEDPEVFTRAFVSAAIARYQLEGREATIAYYNDPASIDGQWYIFISDENDIVVVHPTAPDLLGTDIKEIVSHGFPSGAEVAKATETGRWTEYLSPHPETEETAQKRTWSIRHDGYLFGSGYYEPIAEDAVPVVEGTTVPAVN